MSWASAYAWAHAAVGDGARWGLLYASLLAVCGGVVMAGRASRRRGVAAARRFDRGWTAALAVVAGGMLLSIGLSGPLTWASSMPLQICQLVAVAAPVAQATRRRLPRAVVYFWGVALSGQAFLHAPAIGGLTHPDTYLSWGFHVTNLAAAAYALLVRRYRPSWRDWRLNVVAILAYAAIIFPVDAGLWTDYGMIGPHVVYPPIAWFGPWPLRVVWLAGASIGMTAVLMLPWRRNRFPRPLLTPSPARAAERSAADGITHPV